MTRLAFITLFIAVLIANGACADAQAAPPRQSIWNVVDFGAIGDGSTLDTAAISNAIVACSEAGGGTVLIPGGHYLTGAIELKSHVRLELDTGATLLASQQASDYPLVEDPWEPGKHWLSALLYAHDAEDVIVAGGGTIDGQGASWWAPVLAMKAKRHIRSEDPTRTYEPPPPSSNPDVPGSLPGLPMGRPQLIRFLRCTDVVIEDVKLLDSPEWNIHPLLCDRVRIDGVTIGAHIPSPNTDGIDPESCRCVRITNCRIDDGDDCITLKSGENESGRRVGRPDEDIMIADCITYNGHGGVTIGSEMSGGIRNVTVANCVFHGTDSGIRIKSQRGRGGIIEGLSFNNIIMQDVPHPFVITTFYMGKDKPGDSYPVSESTPRVRDILISNVTVRGAMDAGSITGLRELPISDITFSNVHVRARHGFSCTNATDVSFRDCVFETSDAAALSTRDCSDIDSQRLAVEHPATRPDGS
jgi:polygalacturonase